MKRKMIYQICHIHLVMGVLFAVYSLAWVQITHAEETAVGLGIFAPALNLNVGLKDDANQMNFLPSHGTASTLILEHGNLGLSLSNQNPVEDEDLEVPMRSKFDDYQFSFLTGKRNFFFYYQKYESYYVDNASKINGSYNRSSSESLFKDMTNVGYGGKYIYVYSPKDFSLSSAYGLSARQTKSGGSWLSSLGVSKNRIHSPTKGMAPSYAGSDYDTLKNITSISSTNITAEGGYAHAWIRNNYYFNIVVLLGLVIQDKGVEGNAIEHVEEENVSGSRTLGFGFGYNGEVHRFDFRLLSFAHSYTIDDNQVEQSIVNGGFLYGYRFGDVDLPVLSSISKWFDF